MTSTAQSSAAVTDSRADASFDMGHMDYGKSDIRLVRVYREGDRQSFRDVRVDVLIEGRIRQGYTEGDNTDWMSTDTIRNGVYFVADQGFEGSIEEFGKDLVRHYVSTGPLNEFATVKITEKLWDRFPGNDGGHDHAFVRAAGLRTAVVKGDGENFQVDGGITDLQVFKTTQSGWVGYLKNNLTTLPETTDRILATAVTAEWSYSETGATDYDSIWTGVRDQIIESFGDHYSFGAQNDIYLMGKAVLMKFPSISRIHFSLPNLHHIEYDVSRFGRENARRVYHATAEPYGLLQGEVVRG
ncbi:factor-independent urate hydroxylase [Streptomyces sp. NPDC058045]|uniref:factor-independent urate hydroxylase n=1 Tax=Streptomyces sp. NPDC058045 TaxID=3346311 RepID=UPI0036DFBD20